MRWMGALLLLAAVVAAEGDRDGDGLSDFAERHKHFTDPDRADSDGDGTPDGDWDERREYAYTIRTRVRVLRPAEALTDDYQDARVVAEDDDWVELEVVHYPLNTVADALAGDPEWRRAAASHEEYLAPGPTANWDAELRGRVRRGLAATGLDPDALDDKALVERAAPWLLRHAPDHAGFTTFFAEFRDGAPRVAEGLEEAARNGLRLGLPLAQQWERELFAKGMFLHRARGSCTSTAIYLTGCLRALGVPTRIVYCIPAVDGADAAQRELVRRGITHERVRATILRGLPTSGWSSHTFNEVRVGGRWRRLNYARLGANTFGADSFGLMTHVLTVRDWADADMARTVGRRQGLGLRTEALPGANPYRTLALDDRFGAHAEVDNPPVEGPVAYERLTIERILWYRSPDRPPSISLRLEDPDGEEHVLFAVEENDPAAGSGQYRAFYAAAGKEFVLRAPDGAEVALRAERGYWGSGWFYARIPPTALASMRRGVPHRLVARDDRWTVDDGVVLVR